jgi:hypothetical protein
MLEGRDWIAVIAATLGIVAYFLQNQTALKLLMGLASQVWSVYFFLLGLTTAQFVQMGTGLRTWISIYVNKYPKLKIPYLALVIAGFCMAMLFTWRGAVSLLPTLGAINSTVAYLFQNKTMRLMFLLSSVFSLSFAILIGSPILLALESLGIAINLIAIQKAFRGEACIQPSALHGGHGDSAG